MKVISFANQKGGAGKTSASKAFATWVHCYTNYKVLVIDADFQQSFSAEREKDESLLKYYIDNKILNSKVSFYNELIDIKGGLYPVYSIPLIDKNLETFVQIYERAKNDYDFCIVDVPGTIHSRTFDTVIGYINNIFIPTDVDDQTIHSSVDFAKTILSLAIKNHLPNLESVIFFFNRFTAITNKQAFIQTQSEMIAETSVPFLDNYIKQANDHKMENSTIWPMKNCGNEDHYLYKFCLEVINNIKS